MSVRYRRGNFRHTSRIQKHVFRRFTLLRDSLRLSTEENAIGLDPPQKDRSDQKDLRFRNKILQMDFNLVRNLPRAKKFALSEAARSWRAAA